MHLTEEGFLIRSDGSLSFQATGQALRSEDFDKILERWRAETARDINASEVTTAYREQILNQLKGLGSLTDLQCGLSLCLAAVQTGDTGAYQKWYELFSANKATPHYTMGDYTKRLPNGQYETRMIFSVDPANKAVQVPPPQFGKKGS